jgi:hypothetical protein
MKRLTFILKGILFYVVFIYSILFICAIDSLSIDATIAGFLIMCIGILICYHNINANELHKYCFVDFFNNLLNKI